MNTAVATADTTSPNELGRIIKSYHPKSDPEAMDFMDAWCKQCSNIQRDDTNQLIRSSCRILHKASTQDEFDKTYPIEWQRDDMNQPHCIGFDK